MTEVMSFAERVAARRQALIDSGKIAPPAPAAAEVSREFSPDVLLPDFDEDRTDPLEVVVDEIINNIGIIDAYKRWLPGQKIEDARGRTESIMCQCPWPWHEDAHPSAWVNTDKNVFHCSACGRGGDQMTIAGIRYGYSGAPTGKDFHDLRRMVALEEGIDTYRDERGNYRYFRPDGLVGMGEADGGSEEVRSEDSHGGDSEAVGNAVPLDGGKDGETATPGTQARGLAGESSRSGSDTDSVDGTGPSDQGRVSGGGSGETAPGSGRWDNYAGLDDLSDRKSGNDRPQPARDQPSTEPAPSVIITYPPEAAPALNPPPLALVAPINDDVEDEYFDDIEYPSLDWTQISPADSYLSEVMKACSVDDVPEEYHFWHAMASIGLALGRDVVLEDTPNVVSNLFICILGRTGSGKSKSRRHFDEIFRDVTPFDSQDVSNNGIASIGTPASGEALIDSFIRKVVDPVDKSGKTILQFGNVRGLVDFNELATLTASAGRMGSTLGPTLIHLYDSSPAITVRTMGRGEQTAKNPFCSVITTSQPSSLSKLLSSADAESGFLNRWFFVAGTYKPQLAITRTRVNLTLAKLRFKNIHNWATPSRTIHWSPEAEQLFSSFFNSHIMPAKRKDESSLLTRVDLLMKKLVLIFTANEASIPGNIVTEIPVSAVEKAIFCWDYLIKCYGITDDSVQKVQITELQEHILRHIRTATEKKQPLSTRDLALKVGTKKQTRKEINEAVNLLDEMGYIEQRKTPPGHAGRPTIKYLAV